jgi:hypothetical protein
MEGQGAASVPCCRGAVIGWVRLYLLNQCIKVHAAWKCLHIQRELEARPYLTGKGDAAVAT